MYLKCRLNIALAGSSRIYLQPIYKQKLVYRLVCKIKQNIRQAVTAVPRHLTKCTKIYLLFMTVQCIMQP